MPIYVASNLMPKSSSAFVTEDIYVKGGFSVALDAAARDAIGAPFRKAGMVVLTQNDNKIWVLGSDLSSWSSLNQTISTATASLAGLMSTADKVKLDALSSSGGGLSGLTTNAPLVTSGGSTPVLSIPSASSSQDGYLRASDWIIFNSKGTGNGTVTTVTGQAPITSTGGTTPVIAMPAASASTAGYLSSTDWNTFNNKANSAGTVTAVNATSPVVSSGGNTPTLSMPASTSSNDGYLKATDWVIFNSKGTGTVQSVNANAPITSSGGINPTLSMPAASSTQNGYLRSTDWVTFNAKGVGNVNTVGVQAPLVVAGTTTDPVITMPAASSTSHGYMTNADKAKIDGIAAGATSYTHPTGDGNLHIPACGTTNSGKFLMAGATAGAVSWGTPVGGVTSVAGRSGDVVLTSNDISGLSTTSTVQYRSLGVNTAAPATAGEIRATDNITAYYSSDLALKENIIALPDALEKLMRLTGVAFDWTKEYMDSHGGEDGYFIRKRDVGLIAQDVEAVLPEIVATKSDGFKAIKYDRIVALLVEAVKELRTEVAALRK